jgi:ADP-sugar diphosphatase
MAGRVRAIDDEIRVCMSQLQGMGPSSGFNDGCDGMLQAAMSKLQPLPPPTFIARNYPANPVDQRDWFSHTFGPVTKHTALIEPTTQTPIFFKSYSEEQHADKIIGWGVFQRWIYKTCKKYAVNCVVIQSIDIFGQGKIGFLKFKADVRNKGGVAMPAVVFMRGGSVAMLILIKCTNDSKYYTVLTRQPRVAIGGALYEIPAGMLDGNGNFAYVATKELEEETGIVIKEGDPNLTDLTEMMYDGEHEGVYPSAGGCDEAMRIFLFTANMTKAQLDHLDGKLRGVADEGETIKVKIIPFADLAHTAPDMKTLSALALYNAMMERNKVPSQTVPEKRKSVQQRSGIHRADEEPDDWHPRD